MGDPERGATGGHRMTAPNAKPDRNACIVRDYTHGAMTMEHIGAAYGITKQRVSQIVKAARVAERKARCASGKHGSVVEYGYDRALPDGSMVRVTILRCADCLEEVEV